MIKSIINSIERLVIPFDQLMKKKSPNVFQNYEESRIPLFSGSSNQKVNELTGLIGVSWKKEKLHFERFNRIRVQIWRRLFGLILKNKSRAGFLNFRIYNYRAWAPWIRHGLSLRVWVYELIEDNVNSPVTKKPWICHERASVSLLGHRLFYPVFCRALPPVAKSENNKSFQVIHSGWWFQIIKSRISDKKKSLIKLELAFD